MSFSMSSPRWGWESLQFFASKTHWDTAAHWYWAIKINDLTLCPRHNLPVELILEELTEQYDRNRPSSSWSCVREHILLHLEIFRTRFQMQLLLLLQFFSISSSIFILYPESLIFTTLQLLICPIQEFSSNQNLSLVSKTLFLCHRIHTIIILIVKPFHTCITWMNLYIIYLLYWIFL